MLISSEPLTDFEQFFYTDIPPKIEPPPLVLKKRRVEKNDFSAVPVYSLELIHLIINPTDLCEDPEITIPRWCLRFVLTPENQLIIAPARVLYEKMSPGGYLAAGYFEFEVIKERFVMTGISASSGRYFTNAKELGLVLKHIARAIEQCRASMPIIAQLKLHHARPAPNEQQYNEVCTSTLLNWALKKAFHIQERGILYKPILSSVANSQTDSDDEVAVSTTPPTQRMRSTLFSDRGVGQRVKRMRAEDEMESEDRMSPLTLD